MDIITAVSHASGKLAAPGPNSAELSFSVHTQQIWSYYRGATMAYGPFCHKERVHDLLRQKISKQIEYHSICSSYCASFVKVKYIGIESKNTAK